MTYRLFEHDKAKKFFKSHRNNKVLLLRINKEYKNIIKNPFNSSYKKLNSVKCPKCHRARVGNYRIIFYISEEKRFLKLLILFQEKTIIKYFNHEINFD